MIEPAISYGLGEDNRYRLETVPKSIQLSVWKFDSWDKYKDEVVKIIYENAIGVKSFHLPFDALKLPFDKIFNMMEVVNYNLLCDKFVIHPNKGIEQFIDKFLVQNKSMTLCIENFPYRKKKVYRNPIEIIAKCVETGSDKVQMCFDTSHAEAVWLDNHVVPTILKYTKVIHLSNRIGRNSHLPFNVQKGDLNLVGFINELKYKYKWNGVIVLEYMKEHHYKLASNFSYLQKLLQ